MASELAADPHIIYSHMNSGVSWPGLVAEFVDNAFDDSAGAATAVRITIEPNRISIEDDGRGIANINALATLGCSLSYASAGNLGQYGVGAKAWWRKAVMLDVETVHNGLRHRHTFDNSHNDNAYRLKTGDFRWLTAYEGKGMPAKGSYTRLTLRNFRDGPPIIIPALVNELQRIYWTGLQQGRSITIIDRRRRPIAVTKVSALAPVSWSDRLTFESSVNGRAYRATVGVLTENVGAYGGLFFGFLYRNICIERSLLPPRVHGQVELLDGWRDALSHYKDDIINDKDELLADIKEKAASVIAKAEEYSEDLRLDGISSIIEIAAARLMEDGRLHVATPSPDGSAPAIPRGPGGAGSRERTGTPNAIAEPAPDDGRHTATGLKVKWERLGHDILGSVSVADSTITVSLNRDCPKIEAMTRQPRYPGIYLAIGSELAAYCDNLRPSDMRRFFAGMLADCNQEDPKAIKNAIRVWWGFLADEQAEKQNKEAA